MSGNTNVRIKLFKNEDVNRALKRFKKSIIKAGVIKEFRQRKEFKKDSLIKREQKQRAVYRQQWQT